ncbi:MAG: 3-deoxy-manno-octulosonate cytidylyltransferase [Gammaproteobacteria bacterium]|nr:3-deoxy-manno-octulosonate cytidylyltransferase [Gammaproteobacteria bacterium]|tara:strand:+ start:499 stop:1212 length:714 start_codon:yes stop_codon:yes gene_type:complete
MINDLYILIPSRIGSTRLENKPLINLSGKSLIQRVLNNALDITENAFVATDSDLIKNSIIDISSNIIMTSADHISGTDRICEAANILNIDNDAFILNLQGDEPFVPKKLIERMLFDYSNNLCDVITVSTEINSNEEINNPNCVMVETDKNQFATKFLRTGNVHNPRRHVGIYGYSFNTLKELVKLKPTKNEIKFKLEQLRFLENGYSIYVSEFNEEIPPGIDTAEDVILADKYIKNK